LVQSTVAFKIALVDLFGRRVSYFAWEVRDRPVLLVDPVDLDSDAVRIIQRSEEP